jgi:hypothetical protein
MHSLGRYDVLDSGHMLATICCVASCYGYMQRRAQYARLACAISIMTTVYLSEPVINGIRNTYRYTHQYAHLYTHTPTHMRSEERKKVLTTRIERDQSHSSIGERALRMWRSLFMLCSLSERLTYQPVYSELLIQNCNGMVRQAGAKRAQHRSANP